MPSRRIKVTWEESARFSPAARATILAHVPETVRLKRADRRRLLANREDWVLKSDYGCEGEEVILGSDCSGDEWRASLEHALPGRWVAQRRFLPARDRDRLAANHACRRCRVASAVPPPSGGEQPSGG